MFGGASFIKRFANSPAAESAEGWIKLGSLLSCTAKTAFQISAGLNPEEAAIKSVAFLVLS